MLRDSQHFDLIVNAAKNANNDWEDRATALKGIGDPGSAESRAYLIQEITGLEHITDAEFMRTKELIGPYLDCFT